MDEIKALFPIGKTQWRKWAAEQRLEFNDACKEGLTPDKAIAHVNAIDWVRVKDFFPKVEPSLSEVLAETKHALEEVFEPVITAPAPKRVTRKKKDK